MLERIDEFVFGKINSALYFFDINEIEKCRNAIADIEEMGINNIEEINQIKAKLQTM